MSTPLPSSSPLPTSTPLTLGTDPAIGRALDAVSLIHAVEIRIADHTIWTTSHPPPQAAEALQAIGVTQLPSALAALHPLPDS